MSSTFSYMLASGAINKEKQEIAKQRIKTKTLINKSILIFNIREDVEKIFGADREHDKEWYKSKHEIATEKSVCMYDTGGNEIQAIEYKGDESLNKKVIKKYDKAGRFIEGIGTMYKCKDTLEQWKIIPKYNKRGNMSELAWYRSTNGSLEWKETFKYDRKCKLIKWTEYKAWIEKCEEHNIIEWMKHLFVGCLRDKTTFKYDEKGNMIESAWYSISYSKGRHLKERYAFKYDDKGNKIEETWYYSDGSPIESHTYKYDANGHLIEESKYKSGELLGKYIFADKYDDKNNTIETTKYEIKDSKEIPQSRTVYEYTFYQPSDNGGQKSENPEKK